MTELHGGCLCGQVRYTATVEGDPTSIVCHCTHCQKQSGAAFSFNVVVPLAALNIQGTLKTFEDRGDSGHKVWRKFCPECGSPIMSALEAMPGIAALKAGTLDDGHSLKAAAQVWCQSAKPWAHLAADLPAFPQNAPG